MENNPPQTHDLYTPDENSGATEIHKELDVLPTGFEFVETDELTALQRRLLEAYERGDEAVVTALLKEYRIKAEDAVNRFQGADYAKAQICLNVYMGVIRKQVGREFREDLEDSLTYAAKMGYDEIADIIEEQLDMLDDPREEE